MSYNPPNYNHNGPPNNGMNGQFSHQNNVHYSDYPGSVPDPHYMNTAGVPQPYGYYPPQQPQSSSYPTGMPISAPGFVPPSATPGFAPSPPNGYIPAAQPVGINSINDFETPPLQTHATRKDTGFAVAFWIHVGTIILLGLTLGTKAINDAANAIKQAAASGSTAVPVTDDDIDDSNDDPAYSAGMFLKLLVIAAMISTCLSVMFFFVIQRFGGAMIRLALYGSLILQIVMALCFFAVIPVLGVLVTITAIITGIYIYAVRKQIPFAAAHLQVACEATKEHKLLFLVPLFGAMLTLLWTVFWALSAFGVAHAILPFTPDTNSTVANVTSTRRFLGLADTHANTNSPALYTINSDIGKYSNGTNPNSNNDNNGNEGGSSLGGFIIFFMLFSYYWATQVFKNIVKFTASSVTGSWWFSPQVNRPIRDALNRAFCASLGTIAFASLIVALLDALRAMARSAENKARTENRSGSAFVFACLGCFLAILKNLAEYFNSWALVFASLMGTSFIDSGKAAINLFKRRGFYMIINGNLASRALLLADFAVGIICGLIISAIALVWANDDGDVASFAGFLGFVVGIAVSGTVTGILTSAVKSVYVCFALNPSALAHTHPESLKALLHAWSIAHPEEYNNSGYARILAPFSNEHNTNNFYPNVVPVHTTNVAF